VGRTTEEENGKRPVPKDATKSRTGKHMVRSPKNSDKKRLLGQLQKSKRAVSDGNRREGNAVTSFIAQVIRKKKKGLRTIGRERENEKKVRSDKNDRENLASAARGGGKTRPTTHQTEGEPSNESGWEKKEAPIQGTKERRGVSLPCGGATLKILERS